MDTFIRAAEIWVPDADGYLLEFGGGAYSRVPEFGAVSRAMCFGRGEGLPGRVWESRTPLILQDLQGGYFQRAKAAAAAGLQSAMAFPVFDGEMLKGVVVLYCGEVQGTAGAVEVWRNDPRVTSDLRLLDGVYGADGGGFETASRETYLPRGTGLPGLAWQREASVFVDGLLESTKFVRADEASGTGIRRGLAVPCPVPMEETYVLAFLSAAAVPIALKLESWVAGAGPDILKRQHGHDEAAGSLGVEERSVAEVAPAIADAYAGVPQVGSDGLVAWPIFADGAVVEIVALSL